MGKRMQTENQKDRFLDSCITKHINYHADGFKTDGFKTDGFKADGFKTYGFKTDGFKTDGFLTRDGLPE
jgi:hypothetical protein